MCLFSSKLIPFFSWIKIGEAMKVRVLETLLTRKVNPKSYDLCDMWRALIRSSFRMSRRTRKQRLGPKTRLEAAWRPAPVAWQDAAAYSNAAAGKFLKMRNDAWIRSFSSANALLNTDFKTNLFIRIRWFKMFHFIMEFTNEPQHIVFIGFQRNNEIITIIKNFRIQSAIVWYK